ncbi:M1 family aminopeptidase [Cytophagaceae bacterium YF14B1]|uniref:M1 family aminopeptidase n=1 Tax=Xanthocytophaga flava TaxID=3048013 RepID=A0AAE3QZI7_9BACT|nr:M1 family aminopeptidase [Xanthocytophaga flavus]MDJ1486071.1 M1 family aminopeptidase [Xanthocytophaga flavus]
MLAEILRFEFDYRKRRAATYLYFAILFILCFAAVTSQYVTIGGVAGGQIKENSPYNLAFMTIIMTFFMTFIASAIMGVAVLRDFDHKMEALIFSKPLSKFNYLFGRFLGSFVVMVLIYCSIWLAFMLGFGIGKHLPWDPSWKEKTMLPFDAWSFIQPFVLYGITNLFIQGAIFFAAGALSRKSIVLYTQGIILFVLYQVTSQLLSDIENKTLASLIDPFGFRAFIIYTEYWTPAQKNTMLVPMEGMLLWNRLIWCGIAILILVITYYSFSFNVIRTGLRKKKAIKIETSKIRPEQVTIPSVSQYISIGANLQQLWKQTIFYSKMVAKEIPFIAIVLVGLADIIIGSFYFNQMYGTSSYPVTANVLGLLNEFDLFFLIIIVFYSGELIWKERSVNINLIIDAMPVPNWVNLVAKFMGLLIIYLGLLITLILCGILIQLFNGYFVFELSLYIKALFVNTLFFLIAWTLLSFFVQIMANSKFVGYALMFVFFLILFFIDAMGIQHPLFIFNSGSLDRYSDMNKYGHFITSFSWIKLYWLFFIGLLFALSVLFTVRGTDVLFKTRLQLGKLRLTKPLLTFAIATIIGFAATGCFVYYNTNKLNTYLTRDQEEDRQVDYEKTLKKFENIPQPRITDVNLKVEIYPDKRDFVAEGYYWLKNKTGKPIQDIHIQNDVLHNMQLAYLKFDGGAKEKQTWKPLGYTIYTLTHTLNPGDSVKMSFKTSYSSRGFVARGSNTEVVYNGTFFNNSYFPSLGYNDGFEIGNDDNRRKHKLPEKERMMAQNDPVGLGQSLFGDDSDYIRFEIVLGTSKDQTAIAPGYLQKSWEEKDRKYFHYKMDVPMVNFYSIVSARYEVLKDKWHNVNLEIYYNKGHEFNLKRMMESMKASLDYFSKNFSPFQFRQMRIMEFPKYAEFAQSFANTVPFSEGIGYIQRIKDPEEDLDMPYYVTAHEVGHQWWGHQVPEANVKGNAMLSETQAQYSALMVLKQTYSQEQMQKFLKYELNRYLRGRSAERKKEQPLVDVERQGYIHYQKGSLAMFALQDYIGEDKVNLALHNFLNDWQYPGPESKQKRYPTSRDLLGYFTEQTPDSLKYIITDMFETITLFENKAQTVTYQKKADKQYEVTLTVLAEKLRADSTGNEKNIAINDWIDVGVYHKDDQGKDKLIYLKKHKVNKKENTFVITVSEEPSKAGIDPLNKLIDRHAEDNVKSAEEKTVS